ncbi:hypothetical protein [Enterobacter cloacae]|uniref:hypothetical protein n=1 Tax=Enterobacter cloacae TaxID=550 RepID=UPI002B202DFA|nr:hypothetical protein [Enterobacter cloacae]MEA5217545.1 hypothetical protein [Enterobacter cloacae]
MSGTIRLPAGMLNQRICHLSGNQRDDIPVQFHWVFNVRAQLCVAGWGFGNIHTTYLIEAIINDVRVSPPPNLNVRRQSQFLLYWQWHHPASLH